MLEDRRVIERELYDQQLAFALIPDDRSDTQVKSFLRECNSRSITSLTIHEAMPGHYLQIAHSNRCPSVLRAMLGSGPLVGGQPGVRRR